MANSGLGLEEVRMCGTPVVMVGVRDRVRVRVTVGVDVGKKE